MRYVSFVLAILTVASVELPAFAAGDGHTSFGGRAGSVQIGGDAKATSAPIWGLSVNGVGPTAYDFLWGTSFHIEVAMLFSRFDYEGEDFPFESEKSTAINLFGIAPGVTFFSNTPVQMQLGVTISHVELTQGEKYRQNYGSSGYLARIGYLISTGITASVEYERQSVAQTIDEDTSSITFDLATATIGWALGKD